jgi:hypothetical protein
MISLIYIAGLGDSADGPLNGFRAFADRMVQAYGIAFDAYSYKDKTLVRDVATTPGPLIVVCHSNGADAYLNDVDPWLVRIGKTVDALCVLDAKPRWNSWASFLHWCGRYQYPLPMAVQVESQFIAFHGSFGTGFEHEFNTTPLPIGHAEFPGDYRPQRWIQERIANLSGRPEEVEIA